ncbi:MAG: cytochrome C oxidase subunit IV family protein [Ilumatobacteraceae bacterium]|nr:cytochrome C oxidase subunit IV family protein [Ilumatobacteraceae bacterium]
MSDITETTELGDGYDQPNEAVAESVEHGEHTVDATPDDHPGEHWSDLKFVYLALGLAVITAVEVALSYMVDDLGPVFLPALLILMLVKFFAVVMYFMHLKFDNRLFSLMFYLGLGLAVTVYVIALLTFQFFNS